MKNFKRILFGIAWPFITTGVVALFVLPTIIHWIDFGNQEIDLKNVEFKSLTRNVTLNDAYFEYKLKVKKWTTNKYKQNRVTVYLPIVNKDWTPDKPINLFFVSKNNLDDDMIKRLNNSPQKGRIHDILWEKPDKKIIKEYKEAGLIVSDNIKIFKLRNELSIIPLIICLIVFLISLLGTYAIISGKAGENMKKYGN